MVVTDTDLLKKREELGIRLKEIREKRKLKQEELAELMSVSRSTISKIEGGKFNCSYDYILKFSKALCFNIILEEKEYE